MTRVSCGPVTEARGLRGRIGGLLVFKYVRSADLRHWFDACTIRIAPLHCFAHNPRPGGVGDPLEMQFACQDAVLHHPDHPKYEVTQRNIERLFSTSLQWCLDARLESMSATKDNYYVFCCALEVNRDAFTTWHRLEGYDTVLRIHSLPALMNAVLGADAAGAARLGDWCLIDPIHYADVPVDLAREILPYSEFIKDRAAFAWQAELRCLFPLRMAESEAPYDLHVPGLENFMSVQPVPDAWHRD